MTQHQIPQNMMAIIINLVCKQNKQLLKIICKDEGIDYESIKHILIRRAIV